MSKYNTESLANLSIEELMNISPDNVEVMTFENWPAGVYQGVITAFEMPNEEHPEKFVLKVMPQAAIELSPTTEETVQLAEKLANKQLAITQSYSKDKGGAINAMFDTLRNLLASNPLGALAAHFQTEGATLPVTFKVSYRFGTLSAEQKAAGATEAPKFVQVSNLANVQ